MKSKPHEYNIVIKYNGDPTKMIEDHDCEPVYLTEIKEMRFRDIHEAIKFLTDCNSPITTINELLPDVNMDMFKRQEHQPVWYKPLRAIVSEQNIKIRHQASGNMENEFDSDAEQWE